MTVTAAVTASIRAFRRNSGEAGNRELLRGSAGALALRIAGLGVAYVFTLICTRTLGAEAWGSFSLALAFLMVCAIFARLGMDTALLRLLAERRAQGRLASLAGVYFQAVRVVVPWSLVMGCAAYVAADFIARRIYGSPDLAPHLRLVAIAIPAIALSDLNSQSLRGLKMVWRYAMIQYVSRFAWPALFVAVLLQFVASATVITAAFVAGAYLVCAGSTITVVRSLHAESSDGGSDPVRWSELFGLAMPLLLASSLLYVKGYIDTVMLGVYMDPGDVGVYAVALKLAAMSSLPLFAVNAIAAPRFAESHGRRDVADLERTVRASTALILAASTPITIALIVMPRWILGIFGTEFGAGASVLVVLAVGGFVNALCGSVGPVLQMTGRQRIFQRVTLIATLAAVVLNVLLIPRLGILGAAVSTAACTIIWNLLAMYHVYREHGFLTLPTLRLVTLRDIRRSGRTI